MDSRLHNGYLTDVSGITYTLGKRLNRLFIILIAATSCVGLGCSSERAAVSDNQPVSRLYSTSFPGHGLEGSLADALPSVRMLSSVAYYRQASFASPNGWSADRPITDRVWRAADTVTTFSQSVVGTGTVLQGSLNRLALLTCAHVVTFEDTIKTYFIVNDEPVGIKAFAVKVNQRNYVADIPGAGSLEVLARNDHDDIAIVGQTIDTEGMMIPVFSLPPGRGGDLTWGSFVYVVGYPVGLRMVSTGIVSQPERDDQNAFLTDVVFNRGMSGGAVLAARSEGSSLEWVGIVTSSSANTEYVLEPDVENLREDLHSREPYEGEIYARRIQRIRYGVTIAVSIDAIRKLAQENRVSLQRRGYRLNIFD